MKRIAFALALVLCLAIPAATQTGGKRADIFENYDLDSVAYVYCDPVTYATNPPEGMDQCSTGTAAEDGWVDARTEDFKGIAMHVDAMALAAGTIDISIYARVKVGTSPIQLGLTNSFAAVGTHYVVIPEALRQIRVGIRINGADDGDAADEDISIYYYGSRRLR